MKLTKIVTVRVSEMEYEAWQVLRKRTAARTLGELVRSAVQLYSKRNSRTAEFARPLPDRPRTRFD